MKSKKIIQRGFTLIEVLIVVVIIGVLAALIIPRFLSAPEKAIVAEANQMLGSLVRAEQAVIDLGGTFVGGGILSSGNWTSLGLAYPVAAAKFVYACTTPSCTATRTVNGSASTAILNSNNQLWTCSGAYTSLTNGGCTVA